MGFFKDFKDDLSEAVNGLATDPEVEGAGNDNEDDIIVNTLDDPELAKMAADLQKEADMEAAAAQETGEDEDMTGFDTQIATETDTADTVNNEIKEESMEDNMLNNREDIMEEDTMVEDVQDESVEDVESEEDEIVDETAVITEGLTVTGNLDSIGSIDIFGSVSGDVACRGKLTVSGSICGDSKANEIFVNSAEIDGNIEAKGSVKVGQGTVIVGNIVATSAVIAGAVKGDIDVHGPVIIDSTAIIVGDIKSKTVQINNGATIDGRCSQCYADVNPASIFDIKTKNTKAK